jgi:hypothetical protein
MGNKTGGVNVKFNELNNLIQYNKHESKLFMPNEIFTDLLNRLKSNNKNENQEPKSKEFVVLKNGKQRKSRGVSTDISSNHIAASYSYIYLVTWLYRYAKYGIKHYNVSELKQILGYSPKSKELDFLIKKNGLLDQIGYLETVKDFPISSIYKHGESEEIEFAMLSDLDEDTKELIKKYSNLSRKYTIKFPVKAFFRNRESEEIQEEYKEDEDGNYYADGTLV